MRGDEAMDRSRHALGKKIGLICGVGVLVLLAILLRQWWIEAPAKRAWQEAAETCRSIDALLGEGMTKLSERQWNQAIEILSQAAEKAQRARRLALEERTKLQERIPPPRRFQQQFFKAPSHREPKEYAFGLREAEARYGIARARLESLLEKYPTKRESAERLWGPPLVLSSRELEPILKEIQQGIEANPEDKLLYHLLAQVEKLRGQFPAAVEALEKALAIDPYFAEAYNDLGVLYAHPLWQKSATRDLYREKAIAAFEKAILVSEKNGIGLPEAHYNLGMFYSIHPDPSTPIDAPPPPADRAKAIEHLEKFLAASPSSSPAVTKAKERLARLKGREP